MPEQSVAQSREPRSREWIDELGMLYWKIGVLVIGLRLVVVLPMPALVLEALTNMVMALLKIGFTLTLVGAIRLLWHMFRGSYRRPTAAFGQSWRAWLGSEWPIGLAIDCLLSALIVLLGATLAAQERLDWLVVAWLAVIGLVRVVFQGRSALARAAGDKR